MKFKLASLLVIFLLCMSFIGCTQADKINGKQIGGNLGNVLSMPDKIIIYNNNTSKELDKTNPQFLEVF